jgi:cytoplasmic iron level regulating protein YaaA (DUF328/UPF0246 family)
VARRRLALLLPPSEGKAPGGRGAAWDPASGLFGPELADQRTAVAEALAAAGGGDQRLLGVGGDALERARAANRSLVGARTLPAARRFTGVVWDHLGLSSLAPGPKRRATGAVVVVSAVAGLVGPADPLPDHRLKLSVSLPPLGNLARFWRGPLSAALNDHLAGRLVVDLLPQEHAAAWVPDPDRYDLRRVALVDERGRVVGHDAKAAKGLLARALLEADDPRGVLASWTHGPYRPAVR